MNPRLGTACATCTVTFDHCCVTLRTIGVREIAKKLVLKCPLCLSCGLANSFRAAGTGTGTGAGAGLGSASGSGAGEAVEKKNKRSKEKNSVAGPPLTTIITDDIFPRTDTAPLHDTGSSWSTIRRHQRFDWSWWGSQAPYCPFCAVMMQPI
jgi:hypothetical protein